MSMQHDDEQLSPEEQLLPNEVQAQLRIARKTTRELAETKAEMAKLQKSTAIDKAGIPDHPARELVFETYEGPLDSESVKAYAEKFGIVGAVEPQGVTEQEVQAQRQILGAGGGLPPGTGDIDAAFAMRNAKSQTEVMNIIREVAGQPGFKTFEGRVGVVDDGIV